MRDALNTIILICAMQTCMAQQNLVRNPSFEDTLFCPSPSWINICAAKHWFQPNSPETNCSGSSDLFHSCSPNVPNNFVGFQIPRTGNAYAGIQLYNTDIFINTNYREYIEGSLSEYLIANKKYCIEFYISLANKTGVAIDRIGMYFSLDTFKIYSAFQCFNIIPPWCLEVVPQFESPEGYFWSDTANWMQVSGEFIAQGGERFFTIGNFRDIYSNYIVNDSNAQSIFESYYYIDDVAVWYCDEDESVSEDIFVPNAFSPNADGNNDTLKVLGKGIAEIEFAIYNRWGELIFKTHDAKQGWDGTYKGEKSEPAVYAWYVKARMRNGKEIFKKGNVTLIR
jgi:gliding motility-associated-like protein